MSSKRLSVSLTEDYLNYNINVIFEKKNNSR